MLQGAQQASVASTASPRPNTAILQSDQPPRAAAAARDGGRGGTGAESLVRGSAVAPCVSCGICGGLLRDATAFQECLHAFCRKCIYDKVTKDNIECCPKCGIFLGNPLEKLRSLIFPTKRRKVVTMRKRKERVYSESIVSSVVGITAEGSTALTLVACESKAHKDLAPVGRDALSQIRGRDFDSACGLTKETGALIVWQAPPIVEEMVAHNQLDPKQDPESFRLPATSDIENQKKLSNISFMVESSSCARPTFQDDENLKGDFLTFINEVTNESNARIMGRYDADISKWKAENTKLTQELENQRERTRILEERLQQELENERTAAAERTRLLEKKLQRELEHEREAAFERTRILEERLQGELENERAATAERTRLLEQKLQRVEHERETAIERTRVLDERLQRESEIVQTTARRNEPLEEKISKLHEELGHGRADNQALMSDILEKSEELATLKYYSNMLESERTYLENQLDHLNEELKCTRKEHTAYVRKVLDAARAIVNDSEPIKSDALPGSRCTSGIS